MDSGDRRTLFTALLSAWLLNLRISIGGDTAICIRVEFSVAQLHVQPLIVPQPDTNQAMASTYCYGKTRITSEIVFFFISKDHLADNIETLFVYLSETKRYQYSRLSIFGIWIFPVSASKLFSSLKGETKSYVLCQQFVCF